MASSVLWTWGVEDVGRWLCSINMTHLVHKFEMANVTGEVLAKMDEGFVPMSIKISPAEKTTLMAAIRMLKSNSYKGSPSQSDYTTSHRPRTHSDEKRKAKKPSLGGSHTLRTTPTEIHVTDTIDQMPPVYKYGTASELLDDKCRHSGWIRKRGGGYKNWRRRYLVLRLGYAYYYENENAGKPKGNFCLHNCSVSQCSEEDKIKQFKWVFKVVPDDPQQRTFYVAAAAKHEMERWIEVLNAEIARFNTRSIGEDDENEYEHIYDPVYEEEEDDHEEDDGGHHEDPVYEGVKDEDEDSDDPYTRVRDELGSFSFPSPRVPDPRISPTHRSATLSTTWQMADPMKPRKGKGDAPIIPPRSAMSLMESTTGGTHNIPADISVPMSRMSIDAENPYLKIVGGDSNSSSSQKAPSPVVTPRSSYTIPPPTHHPHPPSHPPLPPSHPPQRMNSPTDMHDSHPFTQAEIEEEDPYYIRLQTLEEVLPPYCIFDNLPREEAESRLSRTGRLGTYLLRDGTHKGAKHVLSVLTTMENTKHYKLYQKEDLSFCLTEGKMFPALSQLIEYYKQEDLPKTPGIRLSEPYHPLDH